jgi:hypothetical protein
MRKNINPKTLKGQDKLNRMLDLMGKMNTLNESKSYSELELIKKGPNGVVYGIIRENHDYFIKTSNKTSGRFLAEDFSYIGGLQNKYDERYKSYAEAIKHLNMKFDMLNESYGIEKNTNIFESDGVAFGGGVGFGFVMEEEDDEDQNEGEKEIISDADADLEEQKKVLKVDAPKAEEPVEDEVEDETEVDMGGDIADVEFDEEGDEETEEGGDEFGDEGMEDEEGDDNTKKIQKYTGKIGQMLRDMDEADSDLEKYVINSIISAMHLDEMDDEDKEDIIAKLEGEEDEEGMDDFDMEGGDEEVDVDLDAEETPEEGGEEELSEGEDKEDDDDDEKEVVKVKKEQLKMLEEEGICTCGDKCLLYPEAKGVDASDLLKQGAKSGKECIILTDDNMSDLKSEGECKCGGVKIKCKKDKEEKNEGRVFSKKQLMESFLRRETKKSLKKVIKERRELCEECGGRLTEGMCMECDMNEHHMGSKATYTRYPHYDKEAYIMDEEDIMYEKLVGKQHKLDKNNNGKIDAEDFKMLRKGRKDRRRNIDEEDMSVMDAIATGQGYLSATDDLDRDFDGIPNRLDMDNNDDGRLDFEMGRGDDFIELDIDFLRNDSPGTKERERTITTPTTRPGKGDKWRTIKRPKVDPRPKAENPNVDVPRPSYRRRGMFR